MKLAIDTLGCKVNNYETEAVKQLFESQGYFLVEKQADVALINTCSVTNLAERKSRQHLRRLIASNPHAVVVVMGCYTQIASSQVMEIPGVNIVVGTADRLLLPQLVNQYLKEKKPLNLVNGKSIETEYEDLNVTSYSDKTRAFVKIQDGCNNYCSYCIIPSTRGRMRSRPSENVINEISQLVENGFKEIVLTGIHTAGYGMDLTSSTFSTLISEIFSKIPLLHRLRISSIEASEITPEFINLLSNPKMAHHLHIPLQSGSDAILKKMNRHYDSKFFSQVIVKLRKVIPSLAITTDVIVGFPGETEQDFLETCSFCQQMKFSKIHVFPYSSRSGTVASGMANPVSTEIKKRRVNELIAISNHLEKEYSLLFEGKELDMVVERWDLKSQMAFGHTSNYLFASTPCLEDRIGEVIEFTYHHIN